ncbi:MAG TPA: arylsulfotransferase family protein [Gemmatimonadales bacterium]
MHLRFGRSPVLPAALLTLVGCGTDDPVSPSCREPEILASSVAAIPGNGLGAVGTVRTRFADSVSLQYGLAGGARDEATPAVAATAEVVAVPALGLVPERQYSLQAVAYGGCGSATGPALGFTTGALPADLPSYTAGGPDPSPGYVVFGAGGYGLVIDNTGRVVWYHRFPRGPGLNFQAQPNGHFVARPPPASPAEPAPFLEIDPLGNVTRTFGCGRGLPPRFHDLIVEASGSYWLMCDETRTMDLSAMGGVTSARVMGTAVQHVNVDGSLLFEWSPFDHFALSDLNPADRTGASVNWTHGNAIDLDGDGNLLVSFRSLHEITKIDTRTGLVRWRMGGLANQFDFQDTPLPAFTGQHGLRVTGPGRMVLLDNLGDPSGSRAERYEFDEAGRTVRLVGAYGGSAHVVAELGGTTQELPGGRVLVSYGNGARVEEYDSAGNVVWRIQGNSGYVFRAQRIRSLYHPGVGGPR